MKESAWDVALFMLYTPLGFFTNVMVVSCVTSNAALQLAFTFLVHFYISPSNEDLGDLVADFIKWRTESNQEVQELVCNMSWSLGSEYKQQYTYITFQEYSSDRYHQFPRLHPLFGRSVRRGVSLCSKSWARSWTS